MDTQSFVACDNLFKIYAIADLEVVALQGLNLELGKGEMAALVGPSGVGKSTLLNVIGGLDTPSAGSVRVAGWDLLRQLQEAAVTRDIPVIVTSTDPRLLEEAERGRGDFPNSTKYVVQPFEIDELVKTVDGLIGAA